MFARTLEPVAPPRRVLATRKAGWARLLAHYLAHLGVRPNDVSIAGIGFALVAGIVFWWSASTTPGTRSVSLIAAAASIQLRLLCNLLDGMLAVEEGLKSATGEIYNDLPDRIADVVILVGAGYAVPEIPFSITLGWSAAVIAVFTAYVRVLAGSLGLSQRFIGPMAKQHRMFTLTLAAVVAAGESAVHLTPRAIPFGLGLIALGAIATAVRRISWMVQEANAR